MIVDLKMASKFLMSLSHRRKVPLDISVYYKRDITAGCIRTVSNFEPFKCELKIQWIHNCDRFMKSIGFAREISLSHGVLLKSVVLLFFCCIFHYTCTMWNCDEFLNTNTSYFGVTLRIIECDNSTILEYFEYVSSSKFCQDLRLICQYKKIKRNVEVMWYMDSIIHTHYSF